MSAGTSVRRAIVLVVAMGTLIGIAAAPADATRPHKKDVVIVQGGYLNVIDCLPTSARPTDEPTRWEASCVISSIYDGGWTGVTEGTIEGWFDSNGNAAGTFDERFYGTYLPDGSRGVLHYRGHFAVTGTVLRSSAEIVGGTCGFAGSSGDITFAGSLVTGGYRAEWYRSPTALSSDPSCIA